MIKSICFAFALAILLSVIALALGIYPTVVKTKKSIDIQILGFEYDNVNNVHQKNFGIILANQREFLRNLRLSNLSASPIDLLEARSFQPCCSSIGPMPDRILPSQSVNVPILLKTAGRAGPVRHQFSVKTSMSEKSIILIDIMATLISEISCEEMPKSGTQLPLTEYGRNFTVSRRAIDYPVTARVRVVGASSGIRTKLVEAIEDRVGPYGCKERIQRLGVDLPLNNPPGRYSGEILLEWEDRVSLTKRITWEIEPVLAIYPKTLVLKKGVSVARMILRRTDPNVRVASVEGDNVGSFQVKEDEDGKTIHLEVRLSARVIRGDDHLVIKTVNGRAQDYRIPIYFLPD